MKSRRLIVTLFSLVISVGLSATSLAQPKEAGQAAEKASEAGSLSEVPDKVVVDESNVKTPDEEIPSETPSQALSEAPFIDRNGDGINDAMQHRFRRGGGAKGSGTGGKGRGLMKGRQNASDDTLLPVDGQQGTCQGGNSAGSGSGRNR